MKLVVWSDIHFPYHDKKTDIAFTKFLADFAPDVAVLNGDGLDFPTISDYDKNPTKRMASFDEDVKGFNEYLRHKEYVLKGANKGVKLYYNGGNHEDRLRRYLWRKAPQIASVSQMGFDELLNLHSNGWTYTPYHDPINNSRRVGVDIGGLLIIHGYMVKKWSGQSAHAHYEKFGGSGIIGHTHRIGTFIHSDYRGHYQWIESGCMSLLTPEYVVSPDWCQGFTAGYIEVKKNKQPARFDTHPVPIVDNKFIWEGRLYTP